MTSEYYTITVITGKDNAYTAIVTNSFSAHDVMWALGRKWEIDQYDGMYDDDIPTVKEFERNFRRIKYDDKAEFRFEFMNYEVIIRTAEINGGFTMGY